MIQLTKWNSISCIFLYWSFSKKIYFSSNGNVFMNDWSDGQTFILHLHVTGNVTHYCWRHHWLIMTNRKMIIPFFLAVHQNQLSLSGLDIFGPVSHSILLNMNNISNNIIIFLILVLNIDYVTPSKTLYTKTSNISTGNERVHIFSSDKVSHFHKKPDYGFEN